MIYLYTFFKLYDIKYRRNITQEYIVQCGDNILVMLTGCNWMYIDDEAKYEKQ